MDWNDFVTIFNLLDSKVLFGGYFLWRWWQGRKRVELGPVVYPEQLIPMTSNQGTVTVSSVDVEKDMKMSWRRG